MVRGQRTLFFDNWIVSYDRQQCLEVLGRGEVVGIFPEGSRSPDGRLGEAQEGAALLAKRSGAPVVPVWVGGTREVLTKGVKRLRHARIRMRTGEPLSISDYPDGREGIELAGFEQKGESFQ